MTGTSPTTYIDAISDEPNEDSSGSETWPQHEDATDTFFAPTEQIPTLTEPTPTLTEPFPAPAEPLSASALPSISERSWPRTEDYTTITQRQAGSVIPHDQEVPVYGECQSESERLARRDSYASSVNYKFVKLASDANISKGT